MKGSDYFIILILIAGLGVLGFLFTQQDKTPQEIFSDISEKVTGSSSDSTNSAPENNTNEQNPANTYTPPVTNPPATQNNNQPATSNSPVTPTNNNTSTTATPTSQNSTNKEEVLGISINLPEGLSLETSRSGVGLSSWGAVNTDMISVYQGTYLLFVIEKYLSEDNFNQTMNDIINREEQLMEFVSNFSDSPPIIDIPPVETYPIDGEDANQYYYSVEIDGEKSMITYEVVVPSKRITIMFRPEEARGFNVADFKSVISTIKFNY